MNILAIGEITKYKKEDGTASEVSQVKKVFPGGECDQVCQGGWGLFTDPWINMSYLISNNTFVSK